MFKFKQRTPVAGDCTCGYDITLDKDYTVGEFIETVLKEKDKEWGYIGIAAKGEWFGKPNCEYRRGKLISEQMKEDYLNKKVKEVTASGGWSRMDYLIVCEE